MYHIFAPMSSTVGADACKSSGKSFNMTGTFFISLLKEGTDIKIVHIVDSMAPGTDKMTMRICTGIKMVCPAYARNFADPAHFGQEIQIPVDGSQTDIRELIPDIIVDDISRRVICAAGKKLHDTLSLAAVFMSAQKIPPFPKTNIVIIIIFII